MRMWKSEMRQSDKKMLAFEYEFSFKVGCSKFVYRLHCLEESKWSIATNDYNADLNSPSIEKDCKTRQVQLQLNLILA